MRYGLDVLLMRWIELQLSMLECAIIPNVHQKASRIKLA